MWEHDGVVPFLVLTLLVFTSLTGFDETAASWVLRFLSLRSQMNWMISFKTSSEEHDERFFFRLLRILVVINLRAIREAVARFA